MLGKNGSLNGYATWFSSAGVTDEAIRRSGEADWASALVALIIPPNLVVNDALEVGLDRPPPRTSTRVWRPNGQTIKAIAVKPGSTPW